MEKIFKDIGKVFLISSLHLLNSIGNFPHDLEEAMFACSTLLRLQRHTANIK